MIVYSSRVRLSNLLNDRGLGSIHFDYIKGEFHFQDGLSEVLQDCLRDWFTNDYFPNLKSTRAKTVSVTVMMLSRSEFQVMTQDLN